MSHAQTAYNQIKKNGVFGEFSLVRKTEQFYDHHNLTVEDKNVLIPLLAMRLNFNSGNRANEVSDAKVFKISVAITTGFDGIIAPTDQVESRGRKYTITNKREYRVKGNLTHVIIDLER